MNTDLVREAVESIKRITSDPRITTHENGKKFYRLEDVLKYGFEVEYDINKIVEFIKEFVGDAPVDKLQSDELQSIAVPARAIVDFMFQFKDDKISELGGKLLILSVLMDEESFEHALLNPEEVYNCLDTKDFSIKLLMKLWGEGEDHRWAERRAKQAAVERDFFYFLISIECDFFQSFEIIWEIFKVVANSATRTEWIVSKNSPANDFSLRKLDLMKDLLIKCRDCLEEKGASRAFECLTICRQIAEEYQPEWEKIS